MYIRASVPPVYHCATPPLLHSPTPPLLHFPTPLLLHSSTLTHLHTSTPPPNLTFFHNSTLSYTPHLLLLCSTFHSYSPPHLHSHSPTPPLLHSPTPHLHTPTLTFLDTTPPHHLQCSDINQQMSEVVQKVSELLNIYPPPNGGIDPRRLSSSPAPSPASHRHSLVEPVPVEGFPKPKSRSLGDIGVPENFPKWYRDP